MCQKKLWLSRTGHVDPFDFRREEWVDTLHLWFDYWLQDIDNSVMDQPSVDVQRNDLNWETHDSWPDKKTEYVDMHFNPSSDGDSAGPGVLTADPVEGKHTQSFTDDPKQSEKQMVENEMDKKRPSAGISDPKTGEVSQNQRDTEN
ncbi:CocE/NonD family hydrolase C-terminal non-catalytic domain-containing protein [Virgibacillus halophilus]|uniref:CocE/NonD family hydrolase C-terminal non-catalytic domain-containing protein n=1 Tax=Tigheibacillus halophilus TaxID=361280 RepID=A0ABU5C4D4_9BACI|nr:CocE/NonD family hydrolase C-terminal non-catalytic domain-containing protein [Virgibacillus halophilus]